jgi:hypothetical protein
MKLHFSIRDLAWLTLIVAVSLGWWFDRRRQAYSVETFANGSAVITEKATMRQWSKSETTTFWLEIFRSP